jgi:hypothetical protein
MCVGGNAGNLEAHVRSMIRILTLAAGATLAGRPLAQSAIQPQPIIDVWPGW